MYTFLFVLLSGISFGAILFLLSAGLSLTMGLMRIVNLAHGALYMAGAYVGLMVAKLTGNFVIGLLAGAICAGIIGLIMETGFIRRLYRLENSQVLLTIGFLYIVSNIVQWIWGPKPLSGITPAIFSGTVQIGSIDFPIFRFVMIAAGLIMAVLLWLFQDKTHVGAIIRAGMDNREVTIALGIDLKKVFTGIFALGASIAGLCGLLGAPLMGINLSLGWDALMLAMNVVIVGGTGSIQGALVGGLLIGLVDAFGKAYFPQVAYIAIYVAMIMILLFKPSGLMGRKMSVQQTATGQVQSAPGFVPKESKTEKVHQSAAPQPAWQARLRGLIPYLVVVILLLALPPFLSSYYLGIITKVLIFAIFAISLDLAMGYTGLFSMAHAAFFGVAGYTVAILSVHMHISLFWLLVPAAILAAAVAAAIISYFSLRVSGVYFLLVTLAFGQLLSIAATKWFAVTGGTNGLPGIARPNLGIPGFAFTSVEFYYLVFVAFAICFLLLYRITHSSFGRVVVGIRENETRMESMGYNTWLVKYVAMIISGAFAGVAGIFYAYFYGVIVPTTLGPVMATTAILMVIVGGPGTLFGPFIGAFIIVLLENITSIYVPDRWPLILGGIFVFCVILVRGGFASYLSRFWRAMKFRRSNVPDS